MTVPTNFATFDLFLLLFSCWMSTNGTLIWTFTIQIIIIVAVSSFTNDPTPDINGKPRGKSLVVKWLSIELKIFLKTSSDISRKLVSFPFSLQHHHTMKQGDDEKKEKIYQLGDYYSIQYQILRTNIIRIVLQMRRVNVNRPLFTRSSSSSFPILCWC